MNTEVAMGLAGAVAALSFSAIGSALGTGFAAASAIGAWKKSYAQNKPAPFILLSYVGAPLTQTLYGMILMFAMQAAVTSRAVIPGSGIAMLILGVVAGIAIGASALFQGRAGAAAADAHGETGQGLANNMAALGVVETVAIFVMVFSYIVINSFAVAV